MKATRIGRARVQVRLDSRNVMLGEILHHIPVHVKLIGGTITLIKIHRDPVDKMCQGKFRIILLNQEVIFHDFCFLRRRL